jgi:hypothetical protein
MIVFIDHTLNRGFGNELMELLEALSNRKSYCGLAQTPVLFQPREGIPLDKDPRTWLTCHWFVVVQREGLLAFTRLDRTARGRARACTFPAPLNLYSQDCPCTITGASAFKLDAGQTRA